MRGEKTVFALSVPAIFVWDCQLEKKKERKKERKKEKKEKKKDFKILT